MCVPLLLDGTMELPTPCVCVVHYSGDVPCSRGVAPTINNDTTVVVVVYQDELELITASTARGSYQPFRNFEFTKISQELEQSSTFKALRGSSDARFRSWSFVPQKNKFTPLLLFTRIIPSAITVTNKISTLSPGSCCCSRLDVEGLFYR